MKKIFSIVMIMIAVVSPLRAEIEVAVGADVVSEYVWRGAKCGDAAIQPTLGLSAAGVDLSFWGSVGVANTFDTRELDITLSYSIAGATVGVTDYWFSAGDDPYGRYFSYKKNATNHVYEVFAGYDFGFASISWYTNIAGADYKADGSSAFSSYCELAAPFSAFGAEWTASLGFVPFESGLYGTDGFDVTNISLSAAKSIDITESFSLPVSAGLTFNPCAEMAYLVFGISF
ncbi:MAG: hypothetical protein J5596_03920 [Bacteroidaceae bacterium]|nr:hypothetical protein [Bacteroidaceae bacterium]